MPLPQIILLIDDGVAIFIVTFIGLQFHQMDTLFLERLPFTFIPFYAAWVLFAAALQLYAPARAAYWIDLWRVPAAAVLSALPAATLRAWWLGTPVVPVFVAVIGAALAIGLLVSRSIYILAFGGGRPKHG
ncbi:MAG: DUF3054 domain-containing protein [Anaerolineales bacterium]